MKNSRDGTTNAKQLAIYIYVPKRKCQGFQWFSVIGRMYLLTHFFFITRDQLALLLLIYYCNSCRTVPVQTTATSKYLAESNTIFNGQTIGMLAPKQFESCHEDMLTPKSLDNDVSRWFNIWSRQSDTTILRDSIGPYVMTRLLGSTTYRPRYRWTAKRDRARLGWMIIGSPCIHLVLHHP